MAKVKVRVPKPSDDETFRPVVTAARMETDATQLIRRVGAALEGFLKSKGLSKTAAARLFAQPESYINNRVRGRNMTLRSLAYLFSTLDGEVYVTVKPRRRVRR